MRAKVVCSACCLERSRYVGLVEVYGELCGDG